MESFERLASRHDLILVEGAGSPAEINLRARDIANMGFARRAGVPVCLIGDIEKGGTIASLVGTKSVIDAEDAAMIGGFLVNKFRGDPSLFDAGVAAIETRTGWPCFGVIPWLPATARLPAEDAVVLSRPERPREGTLKIAAPMLSRIANFDDADPLKLETGVSFEWVPPGRAIPRDADLVILFGTKSTLGDLAFLREQGWDHDIIAHVAHGRADPRHLRRLSDAWTHDRRSRWRRRSTRKRPRARPARNRHRDDIRQTGRTRQRHLRCNRRSPLRI